MNRSNNEEAAAKQDGLEPTLTGEQSGVDPNLRLISLFNHYRHDWMNDIQVLFGYVKLKKYDKLEHLMEKIKTKVQRESNISKLGVPELIIYLFSVQAEVRDLLLEIEMLQEVHLLELPLDAKGFCSMLVGLIEAYKRNAEQHADEEHRLTIELIEKAEYLQLDVRYQGKISKETLSSELQTIRQRSGQPLVWEIKLFEERQAVMHIGVPFLHNEVNSCL